MKKPAHNDLFGVSTMLKFQKIAKCNVIGSLRYVLFYIGKNANCVSIDEILAGHEETSLTFGSIIRYSKELHIHRFCWVAIELASLVMITIKYGDRIINNFTTDELILEIFKNTGTQTDPLERFVMALREYK